LKIAAKTVDLEIVDVEPVLDFQRSRCSTFVEAARNSPMQGGSWDSWYTIEDLGRCITIRCGEMDATRLG